METFTEPRAVVFNPRYQQDRTDTIAALDLKSIDEPIVDIVSAFVERPCCFPLQSCFGHFVCTPGQEIHTLSPIPERFNRPVRYRIAYIAVCIENNRDGRELRESLSTIRTVDPAYIQFGSADWFWNQYLNSYVLQVGPPRYEKKDVAILEYREATHVQKVRDLFFDALRELLGEDLPEQL